MSYQRVIPRDLFNESKLLKCLGQLALLIHDGKGLRWPLRLEHDTGDDNGFIIEQDVSGDLYCSNLTLMLQNKDDPIIHVYSTYNSKSPYPLNCCCDVRGEIEVFNDDGTFSQEFAEFLDRKNA